VHRFASFFAAKVGFHAGLHPGILCKDEVLARCKVQEIRRALREHSFGEEKTEAGSNEAIRLRPISAGWDNE
jgi:hypothetical protein